MMPWQENLRECAIQLEREQHRRNENARIESSLLEHFRNEEIYQRNGSPDVCITVAGQWMIVPADQTALNWFMEDK